MKIKRGRYVMKTSKYKRTIKCKTKKNRSDVHMKGGVKKGINVNKNQLKITDVSLADLQSNNIETQAVQELIGTLPQDKLAGESPPPAKSSNLLNLIGTKLTGDKNAGQLIKDKIDKKMRIIATKSPMGHMKDVILNTLLNIGAFYIYFPSLILNLPNTTLEDLIPEKDGCKLLFDNEETCKKKIKCLFHRCSVIDDPDGYVAKFKKQSGGGVNSIRCAQRNQHTDYKNSLPLSFGKLWRNQSHNTKFASIIRETNKNILTVLKTISPEMTQDGGSHGISNEPIQMDDYTTSMMYQDVLWTHLDLKHIYKLCILIKMMEEIYENQQFKNRNANTSKTNHSTFDELFQSMRNKIKKSRKNKNNTTNHNNNINRPNNITCKSKQSKNKEHVVFPYNLPLLSIPSERIECLVAHISGVTQTEYNQQQTLKDCIQCPDCTLGKSSQRVIGKFLSEIFSGTKESLQKFIDDLFNLYSTYFSFDGLNPTQFLLQCILNRKIYNFPYNVFKLDDVHIDESHSLFDMLCMIPPMKIINDKVYTNKLIQEHLSVYAMYKAFSIDKTSIFCLLKHFYYDTKFDTINDDISHIKKNIMILLNEYIRISQINKTTREKNNLTKNMKKIVLNFERNIIEKDFSLFSLKSRRKKSNKNDYVEQVRIANDTNILLSNILQQSHLSSKDLSYLKSYKSYYLKIIEENYDSNSVLQNLRNKIEL